MDKSIFLKGVLIGTLIVVCMTGCGKDTASFIEADEKSTEETTQETENSQNVVEEHLETEDVSVIYVYVCGEVQSPGVYILSESSRVCDAFEKAGGFTENAATDYWNQARLLVDGEMLYVPTEEEAKELGASGVSSSSIQDTDGGQTSDKVNINTASKEQLMTLPGIGESKAQAILNYRQEHGDFSSVEEIMNVEGIKEGMYEKIKDFIVIN